VFTKNIRRCAPRSPQRPDVTRVTLNQPLEQGPFDWLMSHDRRGA
jgi:hypothetical protein